MERLWVSLLFQLTFLIGGGIGIASRRFQGQVRNGGLTKGGHTDRYSPNSLGDWTPRYCGGKPADIFFAIDTSADVQEKLVQQQLALIKRIAYKLSFEEDRTRVGVLSYGSDVTSVMRLGAYKTRDKFMNELLQPPSMGGSRDIGKLLTFVEEKGFRLKYSRPSVAHVLVIFTAGKAKKQRYAARKAINSKKTGRYIYVQTIGNGVSKNGYGRIASSPHFVFGDKEGFGIQNSLSKVLAMLSCDVAVDRPVFLSKTSDCQIKRPVDIVFGVDHLSAGKTNAMAIYRFIQAFLSQLADKGDNVRVGFVSPRNPAMATPNRQLVTAGNLTYAIGAIKFPNYSDLLKKARKVLLRGRPTVGKLAVLFVDESVLIDKAVLAEAEKSQQKKMEIFVVSVGEYVDKLSLSMIAGGRNDDQLIRLSSYGQLTTLRKDITVRICRGL